MVSQLQKLATDELLGTLEVVAQFHGAMPTGVTVSHQGESDRVIKTILFPQDSNR